MFQRFIRLCGRFFRSRGVRIGIRILLGLILALAIRDIINFLIVNRRSGAPDGEALRILFGIPLRDAGPYFLTSAGIAAGMFGDDDDRDRAHKRFLQELVSTPFSGIPVVRDVAVAAAGVAANSVLGGKKVYVGDIIDAGALGAAKDIGSKALSGGSAVLDGKPLPLKEP